MQTSKSPSNRYYLFEMLTLVIVLAFLLSFFYWKFQSARNAAIDNACISYMGQLQLAILNYNDSNKRPLQRLNYKPGSKYPHSWRVAILPFIDEYDLYKAYNFNEPWDSFHNQKILSKMPTYFRCQMEDDGTTTTSYLAIGADDDYNLFNNTGTNPVLLIEVHSRQVPWTSTDDMTYSEFTELLKNRHDIICNQHGNRLGIRYRDRTYERLD